MSSPAVVVVLVESAGPLNVGSVARLCANFGIAELRLVAPRCDPLAEESRRMAVHGVTLLENARIFPTLALALADCRRVVATSGRPEGPPPGRPLEPPQSALGWLLAASAPGGDRAPESVRAGLVFGREDRGLSNDELLQAGRLLHLATGAPYRSLNLSHAVAICLHELEGCRLELAQQSRPPEQDRPPGEPVTRGQLEACLADAEALLLEVGFLYPHTAHARMAKLRALLQRAAIDDGEVALVRGMVRQLRWAAQRHCP